MPGEARELVLNSQNSTRMHSARRTVSALVNSGRNLHRYPRLTKESIFGGVASNGPARGGPVCSSNQPGSDMTTSEHTGGVHSHSNSSSNSVREGSKKRVVIPPSPAPLPNSTLSVTNPPPPPTTGPAQPAWSDPNWASNLNTRRRIFCNRSLNMDSITSVGFDMDYTLAQYRSEAFETLAHEETVKKLITVFGYPKEISQFVFDWRYMMRGLIIDKKRGNVVKVDRHKYVKLGYHGFSELTREERVQAYARTEVRDSFDEPDYAMIDTLFSLAEAHLFMNLVQFKDANPGVLDHKSYYQMYRDCRAAVDYCHRDGSLKRAVASNPAKYIHKDPCLVPLLESLKKSGKKLFLATNSLWDYTNVVMNFLLSNQQGANKDKAWLKYFDVVLSGCGKPGFFNSNKPLFIVDPKSGMLVNTDNGAPTIPIGEEDASIPHPPINQTLLDDRHAAVFQGGTYVDLHRMLGIESGTEVLYIGDHIYGDILRSKKTLGWRTMLVVPELEVELEILSRCQGVQTRLSSLRDQRDALDDQIQRLEWAKVSQTPSPASTSDPTEMIESLKQQREEVRMQHRTMLRQHHQLFHPIWGRLLKTGYQNSRLAHQIERFACLYTSHVSNLLFYSPNKRYRGRVDSMAHEEDPTLGLTMVDNVSDDLNGNGAGPSLDLPLHLKSSHQQ